jgi:PEP-CTERM motif-containing protein
MLKKIGLVGGLASVMALGMTMPSMAQAVTTWNFSVNAGFSSYTSTGGGQSGITASTNNTALGLPTVLSWGTGSSGQSSLDLGGQASPTFTPGGFSGQVTTNAPPTLTTIVTANNNPISGNTLEFASIHDVLTLAAVSPPSGVTIPPLTFNVAYDETPNTGLASNCAAPSTTACADIFALTGLTSATINTSGTTPFIDQDFQFAGFDYSIELFINGLTVLDDAECQAVNNADGAGTVAAHNCVGFISQENNSNHFQASLAILNNGPTFVPEPATIALFGSGLFGLGGLIKRRRKAKAA